MAETNASGIAAATIEDGQHMRAAGPDSTGLPPFLRCAYRYTRPYTGRAALLGLATLCGLSWTTVNPLVFRAFINTALPQRDGGLVVLLLCVLLGLIAVDGLSSLGAGYLAARIGSSAARDLRVEVFEHLQRLSHGYYSRVPTSELQARCGADVDALETVFTQTLPRAAFLGLQCAVCIIFLFVVQWPMALLTLLLVPLVYAAPRALGSRSEQAARAREEAGARIARMAQETLGAHAVVKAFGLRRLMDERLRAEADQRAASSFRFTRLSNLLATATTGSTRLFQIILVGVGALLIVRGTLTMGALYAFYLYLEYGVGALQGLFALSAPLQTGMGAMQRVQRVLAEQPDVVDRPDAHLLPAVTQGVRFEGVTFSYTGAQPNLDNVTMAIPAGSFAAIVGPSGGGKSTIVNLLLRFYDPDQGAVTVDGHDLRALSVESLRAQCSVVFQDCLLFDGSIRDNIRLGQPSASDERVVEAACAAQIHDLITSLPDGYETAVGEHGGRLSGGQRQRIALARALVRDPAILLLDEATSALDPATEAAFNATLVELARGRTVISVTHRLASAAGADRIVVVDRGRVVEQGTHDELLARGGVYRGLWEHQAGVAISGDGRRATVTASHLRRIPLFAQADEPMLAALARRFVTEHFQQGEDIIVEGAAGDTFYILARGTADVVSSAQGRHGAERLVALLQEGDFFGEIAMLGDGTRTATVRARTPCVALALAGQHFEDLLTEAPDLRLTIEQAARQRRHETTSLQVAP